MSDFDFGRGAGGERVEFGGEHRSYVDGSRHDSYTDRSEHDFRDDHSSHNGDIDHSYNTSFEGDHSFNTTEINDASHHDFLDLDHAVDLHIL